jgi:broad specificity phosphatase PhoE/ribonuclease HI
VTAPESVVVEADGGSRGNPGPSGFGAVVRDPATGDVLAERSGFLGVNTNNVAEYRGLIAGLEAARDLGAGSVLVRMDSKLVVEQMSGRWQVKHPAMRDLAREASALRAQFQEVQFEWVPRARNGAADRLANEAMDAGSGESPREAPEPAPAWAPPTGPVTTVLLLRHGATDHSPQHRFSGRNDLALSAAGRAQAAAAAQRLARTDDLAAVVTSPLRRARETAEAVAAEVGVPLEIEDGLAEADFGVFEGLTAAEAQERYPAEFGLWHTAPDVAPPGGEAFPEVARRVRRARDAVISRHADRAVVLVTHVTPIKTLVRLALDAPAAALYRMHLDVGSLSRIDYRPDGSASLRLFNDVSHLAS